MPIRPNEATMPADSNAPFHPSRRCFRVQPFDAWATFLLDDLRVVLLNCSFCSSFFFVERLIVEKNTAAEFSLFNVTRSWTLFSAAVGKLVPFFRQSSFRTFRQKCQPQINLEMEIVEKRGLVADGCPNEDLGRRNKR